MSWVRIWIHLVFSTKNRESFFTNKEIRSKLYSHVKNNAKSKEIKLDIINGYHDHVHCLISLNRDLSISKVAQLIKGESSNWINKENLTKTKFSWQDDYWAVSVSESHLEAVRNYILKQEEHHKGVTFSEEVEKLMKKYNWEI